MISISEPQLGIVQISAAQAILMFALWGLLMAVTGSVTTWLVLRERPRRTRSAGAAADSTAAADTPEVTARLSAPDLTGPHGTRRLTMPAPRPPRSVPVIARMDSDITAVLSYPRAGDDTVVFIPGKARP